MNLFPGLSKFKKRSNPGIQTTPEPQSPILNTKRARPAKNFYCNLEDSGLEESPSNAGEKPHWSDSVIEECIYAGLKPNSIMRILNTFILARIILFSLNH